MAKKVSFTKDKILETAFQIIKEKGLDFLSVRNLAAKLHCSTQPIYNIFVNMDHLKEEVIPLLKDYLLEQITNYNKTENDFLNTGLGYLRFAKEEKHLFALFFLQNEDQHNIIQSHDGNQVIRNLMEKELAGQAFSEKQRDKIFLQMMIFIYGMAVLVYLDQLFLTEEEIILLLTNTFDSYKNLAVMGEN